MMLKNKPCLGATEVYIRQFTLTKPVLPYLRPFPLLTYCTVSTVTDDNLLAISVAACQGDGIDDDPVAMRAAPGTGSDLTRTKGEIDKLSFSWSLILGRVSRRALGVLAHKNWVLVRQIYSGLQIKNESADHRCLRIRLGKSFCL